MKMSELTNEIESKYFSLFEKVINGIEAYKADRNIQNFKSILCEVVDETPNLAYLDPDALWGMGIDADESQWVELDDLEVQMNKDYLKEFINESEEFEGHQLCIMGSGSILITLFGDAFHEIYC